MIRIRSENPSDITAIRYVNEQAFETNAEAVLVDRLRDKGVVTLSLVALEGDSIVGHILFTPVTIEADHAKYEAITLAPIAVMPARQRKGIGAGLIKYAFEQCRRLGHNVVVLIGHPEYYPRFGFVPAKPKGLTSEFEVPDEAWMVVELIDNALDGISGEVRFQPEFADAM
ncbi:MAG: N-acetyltransferase [Chloroflexi bacterium]|jgi:putative acetyltransferase|nr:N-acetyltransferase [Chloroflexota bacterium]MBT7080203.1 N-acetyltransferase [Chloroflexota bacterium]MBT7290149.1 N-acetyltransferase [Chloroflexota bacterium]